MEQSRHFTSENEELEVVRLVRDVPPMHYTFKIESFSLLSKILLNSRVDNYELSDFEVGGYKWRLSLYPTGNKKRDAGDHISLYFVISETNGLPLGWEVNATFKFFVFDQVRDKYLTVQEDGRVRRFHALKTEWGFPRLLSLSNLNDPSNGYLIDDCCVFGAEVFVIKCDGEGESFSMIKEPKDGTFTWKLDKFSELKEEFSISEAFTVGGHQWKLLIYPSGDSRVKGKHLSLCLCFVDNSDLRPGWKLYAERKLRIKDQVHGKHLALTSKCWFSASAMGWGSSRFISLSDLNDPERGFIVKDTLIVEVEFTLLSIVKYFA